MSQRPRAGSAVSGTLSEGSVEGVSRVDDAPTYPRYVEVSKGDDARVPVQDASEWQGVAGSRSTLTGPGNCVQRQCSLDRGMTLAIHAAAKK